MLKIKKESDSLTCLQVYLNRRKELIEFLRRQLKKNTSLHSIFNLKAENGDIFFEVVENSELFIITLLESDNIHITIPFDDYIELIESIEEHWYNDIQFPLDHSFETYGARFIPETVRDVVVETINESGVVAP
ncbi:MAG: hypothetical protein ACOCXT_06975 [Candidatus Dojkabacteria bacterium]